MSLRPESLASRRHFLNSAPPSCLHAEQPATTSLSLHYLLTIQNQALQQIAEQNVQMSALIARISNRPVLQAGPKERVSSLEPVGDDHRLCKVVLDAELSLPILKERGFVLAGAVKDENNQLAPETAGTRLSVALYTQDATPLHRNIAGNSQTGKQAVRGTVSTEVREDGTFLFSNIVINEVSSHYIDEAFTLVVSDEEKTLKPLVIKRLAVRARRVKDIFK